MKTFAIALLAGVAALSAGSARASDVYVSDQYAGANLVQQVRLVCDEHGNCYRKRGGARVVVRDSYNYYPPHHRHHKYRVYRDEPRAGIGIHAPGVNIGVGVGTNHW